MNGETAAVLAGQGAERAAQSAARILLRSAQAGAFIALAALFSITLGVGVEAYGLKQLAAGLAFSLGLILVVLGGGELFTGCNLTVTGALLAGRVGPGRLLRQWGLCYAGNFLGALGVTALWVGSGLWRQADGAWLARALAIAGTKGGLAFWPAFWRGVGCNILVCLAVALAAGARDSGGKIAAIVFPITGFIALGFEHSVANMCYLPLGLWLQALNPAASPGGLTAWSLAANLAPVTLGNIVGGALLVAGGYGYLFRACRAGARGLAGPPSVSG